MNVDTFGNLINQTGSSSGNLGFQSKYYDQESGLNYYYHRYYYPSIGRFINEDPIGLSGGLNMFSFIYNDPINSIDPKGLFKGGYIEDIASITDLDDIPYKWGLIGKLFNLRRWGKVLGSVNYDSQCVCDESTGKWKLSFELNVSVKGYYWHLMENVGHHEYQHAKPYAVSYYYLEPILKRIENQWSLSSLHECEEYKRMVDNTVNFVFLLTIEETQALDVFKY